MADTYTNLSPSSGSVDFTGSITGTLPVANGGTNSSTALNNNRVIQSVSGKIQEAAAITASRALISDANGIPTHSAVTSASLAFVDATSSIQTQINTKAVFPVLTTASVTNTLSSLSSTTYADLTSWTITFTTTRANEVIFLLVNMCAQLTTANGTGYFAYVLDAGSTVPIGFFTVASNNEGGPVGVVPLAITVSAAGSHTIKLQYKVDSGKVMSVFGTVTAVNLAQLQVVQF